MTSMTWSLEAGDGRARAGWLNTPHGRVQTPAFMPVGTRAAVKAVDGADLAGVGAEIVLANTYHLMLRPGAERVARLGGLHRFMNWPHPILTDSGGFQIFSMGHGSVADEIKGRNKGGRDKSLLKVTEEGARFKPSMMGSSVYTGKMTEANSYKTEGIGEDFIPSNYDFSVIDDMVRVNDKESFLL